MTKPRGGRVVLGVDDSPAGLRTAVAQARQLDRDLLAVRAFLPPRPEWERSGRITGIYLLSAGSPQPRLLASRERAAAQSVEQVFAQALGGVPADVTVCAVAVMGPAVRCWWTRPTGRTTCWWSAPRRHRAGGGVPWAAIARPRRRALRRLLARSPTG